MTEKPFDFRRLEESITVESHNPSWLAWYEEEVGALGEALQGLHPKFAHVGSSAVSGLKSKPIVDIMMGLDNLSIPREAQSAIEALGYEYFGRLHANQERLFARKRGPRSFNLQVVPFGAKEWDEKLIFRDFLRTHPEDVQEYSKIKDEAIGAGKLQLLDYHRHKDQVVTAILQRALNWHSLGRPA